MANAEWELDSLIDEISDKAGYPTHVVAAVIDNYMDLNGLEYDEAYNAVVSTMDELTDDELEECGL